MNELRAVFTAAWSATLLPLLCSVDFQFVVFNFWSLVSLRKSLLVVSIARYAAAPFFGRGQGGWRTLWPPPRMALGEVSSMERTSLYCSVKP